MSPYVIQLFESVWDSFRKVLNGEIWKYGGSSEHLSRLFEDGNTIARGLAHYNYWEDYYSHVL